MATPKRYSETLNLLVSVDLKAELEARAIMEECSMASIIRRAIQAELFHANNRSALKTN